MNDKNGIAIFSVNEKGYRYASVKTSQLQTCIMYLFALNLLFFPAMTDAYAQQQDLNNNLQVGAVNSDYRQEVKFWIDLGAAVAAIIAGVITGIWAYTKYVLEKSLLPPVQFFVECKNLGKHRDDFLKYITSRNESILAHGIRPVAEQDYNRMEDLLKGFLLRFFQKKLMKS